MSSLKGHARYGLAVVVLCLHLSVKLWSSFFCVTALLNRNSSGRLDTTLTLFATQSEYVLYIYL